MDNTKLLVILLRMRDQAFQAGEETSQENIAQLVDTLHSLHPNSFKKAYRIVKNK